MKEMQNTAMNGYYHTPKTHIQIPMLLCIDIDIYIHTLLFFRQLEHRVKHLTRLH